LDAASKKPIALRLFVVYLCLLAFALTGGAVGIFSLNKVGTADKRLYALGVESMGAIAKVRQSFTWAPSNVRDIILETDPNKLNGFLTAFGRTKTKTAESLGTLASFASGDDESEKLYKDVMVNFSLYWDLVDKVVERAIVNRNAEAIQFMRDSTYPQFLATDRVLNALQDKMRADADRQLRSNRQTITYASVVMAVCTVTMVLLSLFFASFMEKLKLM